MSRSDSVVVLLGRYGRGSPDRLSGAADSATAAVDSSAAPAAAIPADSAAATPAETPKRAKLLDSLIIKGLAVNMPSVIRNNIPLHRGGTLSPSVVKETIKKVYGLGLFRSIDIYVVRETDSSATLLLSVVEFPLCEKIEWSGLNKIKQKDLEEKLGLKRGQIVTDNAVFHAKNYIKDEYAKKGYLFADISIDQVPGKAPGNVVVQIKVKEGSSLHIKHIYFYGNKEVSSKETQERVQNQGKTVVAQRGFR